VVATRKVLLSLQDGNSLASAAETGSETMGAAAACGTNEL
jgi:hypothetical protein